MKPVPTSNSVLLGAVYLSVKDFAYKAVGIMGLLISRMHCFLERAAFGVETGPSVIVLSGFSDRLLYLS